MTVLYDYWRSSAAYRLRIALNLIGETHVLETVDLLAGANRSPENLARNPQGLVPSLDIDGAMLTQSLAILEYLDETRQVGFLPTEPLDRARVRALAYAVAMEIHPVCNLSVATYGAEIAGDGYGMKDWMHAHIPRGLAGLEAMLKSDKTGTCCHGDTVTMADICLVPQIYNATRWAVDTDPYPTIMRINTHLTAMAPVAAAHPDRIGPPRS